MQTYLRSNWLNCRNLLENKTVALFLDFDGTLAPLAATPQQAEITPRNKVILENLAQAKNTKVAIISGREVKDLKAKIGVKDIIYVGNHGLEMAWDFINFESFIPPEARQATNSIKGELARRLSLIKNIIIEDKKLTLSVHYRLVDDKDWPQLMKIFFEVCRPYLIDKKIRICTGKKVLEVRPYAPWEKNHAISWLLKKYQENEEKKIFPIFVGDDKTDEVAFSQLKDNGLTVIVGREPSLAQYYVNDTTEVTWMLEEILKLSLRELAPV